MITSRKFFVGLVLLSCAAGLVVSEVGKKEEGEKKLRAMKTLLSEKWDNVEEVQTEMLALRKHVIGELIGIVEDKANRVRKPNSVRAAMFVLGEIRAVEAVEALVEHIGFPDVYEAGVRPVIDVLEGGMIRRGLEGVVDAYPAVAALVKIGEPCLDRVVTKLADTDNVVEKKACLATLFGLRDREYILYMLEKAIEKEKDPKKIENLQRAMERLTPKKKETEEESAETKP